MRHSASVKGPTGAPQLLTFILSMRQLLFSVTKKDLEISYFSGTGAGGQHRNKHQNCVRLYHPDSGARSTGQSHRSRESNLREAFKALVNTFEFKYWHSNKTQEILSGETLDQRVNKMMSPENLKIEYL